MTWARTRALKFIISRSKFSIHHDSRRPERRKRSTKLAAVGVAILSIHAWSAATPATAPTVTLAVDATTAPRKIFHASLKIPASPGDLTLYYPKWIPGEHAP